MIEACKELWIASKMHDNLVSGRIYSYVLVLTGIRGLLRRRKMGVGWAYRWSESVQLRREHDGTVRQGC